MSTASDTVKTERQESSSSSSETNSKAIQVAVKNSSPAPSSRAGLVVPDPIIQQPSSPSSVSEPSDHWSPGMLHLPSVPPSKSPTSPHPSHQQQNNHQHNTRVVVCGMSAAASDLAASAKRPRRRGGPPASPNKKSKTAHAHQDGDIDGDEDKQYFQRLWSDDDEIGLLKGLSEYASKTGIILRFASDFQGFHDFIAQESGSESAALLRFSKSQLLSKVKNLREKYSRHAAKEGDGVGLAFLKSPHERLRYRLSKTIWGAGAGAVAGGINTGEAKKSTKKGKEAIKSLKPMPKSMELNTIVANNAAMSVPGAVPPLVCLLGNISERSSNMAREVFLRQGLQLISHSPSPSFVEKWNDLQKVKMKLYMQQAALIREQIQLMANI